MKSLPSGSSTLLALAALAVASSPPSLAAGNATAVKPPDYYEAALDPDQERGAGGATEAILPVQFPHNSADITKESAEALRNLAIALNGTRLRSSRFRIEGYTDSAGSPAYNMSLSQRRAQAVKRYLVDHLGVEASRLEARGFGASQPLPGVAQDTEEGRALNRRVIIVRAGSADVAQPKQQASQTDKRPAVRVTVTYQRGGKVETLKPEEVLRPRDNYRVTFTPDRDSYVYIFQFDENGKIDRIFPNGDFSPAANPVKASRPNMVPPEGRWLWLDDTVGKQEIVVVASQTELVDAQTVADSVRQQKAAKGGERGPGMPTSSLHAPPPDVFSYRLPFRTESP